MQLAESDLISLLPDSQLRKIRAEIAAQEPKKRKLEAQAGSIPAVPTVAPMMNYELATVPENIQFPYPYMKHAQTIQDFEQDLSAVQKILAALKIEPLKTIRLPKLQVASFPTKTRFPFNEEDLSLSIVYRPWMYAFMEYFDAKMSKMKFGNPIALIGPRGIGKSQCLYLLVALLRQQVQKYRAFYIPFCALLQDAFGPPEVDRTQLACDLIVSFPEKDARPFIDAFANHTLNLEGCLMKLQTYYRSHQIQIVLVLDQYNTIGDIPEKNAIVGLIQMISTIIPTVITFAAHNHISIKQENYDIYTPQNYLVEKNEAVAFCRLHDTQVSEIEVEDIISVVGGVPLELVTCLKYDGTVDERISKYSDERDSLFTKRIERYLSELDKPVLNIALKNIPGIIVRAGQPGSRYLEYDKKLILTTNNNGSYSYSFINKIALNAVWSFLIAGYRSEITVHLDTVAHDVIASQLNQSAKGRELEYYIIMRSCLYGRFAVKQLGIEVNDLQIHYFVPSTLASLTFINYNAFLVPNIDNLAGFDFVVYEFQKNCVYLVQVTAEETAKGHRDKSLTGIQNPESQLTFWMSTLKHVFRKRNPSYYEIYITKDESGSKENYNSVKISEMTADYPALAVFYP